jgi:hypothetical protein
VKAPVHKHINAIWTKFREVHPNAAAQDVEQVVRIIDRHFEARWYNRADLSEGDLSLLEEAREKALRELQRHFAR